MTHQVALVTGGSRGIGLGCAVQLAREGFSVAINGTTESQHLRTAVEAVSAEGVSCLAVPFDVSDIDTHDEHLEEVEAALGNLTTLVNNAGVGVLQRDDILNVTEESWDKCHSVNAKALFFLSQRFARRLLARQRDPDLFHSIVNVTSANAVAAAETRAEYCAAKAAAAMVSKTFAVRLGREGINVFDVQPGLISTDMTASVIQGYAERAEKGLTLIPRIGTPLDVGKVIASLASGKLPYMTGQVISADGGLLVSRF